MTSRPAAYQLAERKRLLSRLETSLNATLSGDMPTTAQLEEQLGLLNAIFLEGMQTLTPRDMARGLRAQAQFLKTLDLLGKICPRSAPPKKSCGTD